LLLYQVFDMLDMKILKKKRDIMADLSEKHQARHFAPILLLLTASIFGFIAGLGGTMLLSQSLLRQFLQKQQEENAQMSQLFEQRTTKVQDELTVHRQELQALRKEIDASFLQSSRSSRNELLKIQKRIKEVEQEMLVQTAKQEKRLVQMEETGKQAGMAVNSIQEKMEALDKEQKEQIRQLKSRIADLENKIAQALRTTP
jgi:hypothetical protein